MRSLVAVVGVGLLFVAAGARAEEGKQLITLKGSVTCLAVSSDGKWIATGNSDGKVDLWDAASGKLTDTLAAHGEDGVQTVGFSPDSKLLVSTGSQRDSSLKIWDLATKKPIARLNEATKNRSDVLSSIAFSADGKLLAAVGNPGMRLWDVASKKLLAQTKSDAIAGGKHIEFSPDGKLLAWCGSQYGNPAHKNAVLLWDVASAKLAGTLADHADLVWGCSFAGPKTLVSGSEDKTVKFWDLAGRKVTATAKDNPDAITTVAASPDGKRVATAGNDGTIRVREVPGGKPVGSQKGFWAAFLSDGSLVTADNAVRLWHLK
jgi:WD40 repeat protein